MRAESKFFKMKKKISAFLDKLTEQWIIVHCRQNHNFSYLERNMQIIPIAEKTHFEASINGTKYRDNDF
jgi:hypothetical protein